MSIAYNRIFNTTNNENISLIYTLIRNKEKMTDVDFEVMTLAIYNSEYGAVSQFIYDNEFMIHTGLKYDSCRGRTKVYKLGENTIKIKDGVAKVYDKYNNPLSLMKI